MQEGSKSFLVFCCCLIGRVFLQHAVLVNQKKKKILLLENLELAIMSPYLKIPCMLLFFLNVSASV